MATFDQRGQKVNYQFNANNSINFNGLQDQSNISAELKKLHDEIRKAMESGALEQEQGIDVQANVAKAIVQVEKSAPNKESAVDYLERAKALVAGISSLAGLVTALTQAIEIVKKIL